MTNSIIIIIIPSSTIRSRCSSVLSDFGKNEQKTAVAVLAPEPKYLPLEEPFEFVILSERRVNEGTKTFLLKTLADKDHIYIGRHESDEEFEFDFIDYQRHPRDKISIHEFNRIDTDPFFRQLSNLFNILETGYTQSTLDSQIARIRQIFALNWAHERDLNDIHQNNAMRETVSLSNDFLCLWNDDTYGKRLHQNNPGNVALSVPELEEKLKGKNHLLVLAELNWKAHKLSQFYGYEIVRDLIFKNDKLKITFVSGLARSELHHASADAQLLVPVFNHLQLPLTQEKLAALDVDEISEIKWEFLQSYHLKPEGMFDKLLHDLRKITHDTPRDEIHKFLHKIKVYRTILPDEITGYADYVLKILHEPHAEPHKEIRKLQQKLEESYLALLPKQQENGHQKIYPYRIMIVDDNRGDIANLERGFAPYFFEVHCFNEGTVALKAFSDDPKQYHALIVDMELLDDFGNWQKYQGFEILEIAHRIPQVVLVMLTGYSRLAFSKISEKLNLSNVIYIPKYPYSVLPPDMSFIELSKKIARQIKRKQKQQVGPKNGVWNNGLLAFYYSFTPAELEQIWQQVTFAVESFLKSEDKQSDLIPANLFNVNTTKFELKHLDAVLRHRLIVLYYQHENQIFNFERQLKKYIGFNLSNPKQYLNSLLGLSAHITKSEEDTHLCSVEMSNLFHQEKNWLQARFQDFVEQFAELYAMMNGCCADLSPHERDKMRLPSGKINTIEECVLICEKICKYPPCASYDIQVDFDDFLTYYPEEISQLEKSKNGQKLVLLMRKFLLIPENVRKL